MLRSTGARRELQWWLLVVALATALIGCDGDRGARAEVRGLSYIVSAGEVPFARQAALEAALTSYAPIDRIDADRGDLQSQMAFRITGVNPERVLVIKIRPGIQGANAPPGPFMFLLRGEGASELLCPYMAPVLAKPGIDCD
jgi:hypothetical protein